MIRLIAATLIATALWPVDENNQMLGLGSSQASLEALASSGVSIVQDVAGFCDRNAQACETIGDITTDTAYQIGSVVYQASMDDDAPAAQ